jgi:hypothetical protein
MIHGGCINGVSISEWTGIESSRSCPSSRWKHGTFRIAHIAGALALGSCSFRRIPSGPIHGAPKETRLVSLLLPFCFWCPRSIAAATVIGFVQTINSGTLPEMGGLTTWAAFPGTEIFQTEVNWFGIPLLIATLSAPS